jgi:hypothetical protein
VSLSVRVLVLDSASNFLHTILTPWLVAVAALHTQKKKELHKTHQSFLARSASGLKRSISRPSSPHEEVISVCVCVCVCVCLCCVCECLFYKYNMRI